MDIQAQIDYNTRRFLGQFLAETLLELHRPKARHDVQAFLASPALDWTAEWLGLDPERVREKAEEVEPAKLRAIRRLHVGGHRVPAR